MLLQFSINQLKFTNNASSKLSNASLNSKLVVVVEGAGSGIVPWKQLQLISPLIWELFRPATEMSLLMISQFTLGIKMHLELTTCNWISLPRSVCE